MKRTDENIETVTEAIQRDLATALAALARKCQQGEGDYKGAEPIDLAGVVMNEACKLLDVTLMLAAKDMPKRVRKEFKRVNAEFFMEMTAKACGVEAQTVTADNIGDVLGTLFGNGSGKVTH